MASSVSHLWVKHSTSSRWKKCAKCGITRRPTLQHVTDRFRYAYYLDTGHFIGYAVLKCASASSGKRTWSHQCLQYGLVWLEWGKVCACGHARIVPKV